MLALHLSIAAAALVPVPRAFPYVDDNPGMHCPYNSIARADLLVAGAVQLEPRPPRGDESAALARVAAIVQACAEEYFWTENRASTALNSAIGHAMRDKAASALGALGLDFHFLDEVAADLGESGVAALLSSASDVNLERAGNIAMRRVVAHGHDFSPGSEEWVRLGREIARGVFGIALAVRSAGDFTLQ